MIRNSFTMLVKNSETLEKMKENGRLSSKKTKERNETSGFYFISEQTEN